MKKCIRCKKELPDDSKSILCERCKSKTAEAIKKAAFGAVGVVGSTALALVFGRSKIKN